MKKTDLPIIFKSLSIEAPVVEFRFHPIRRWRFDYAWPKYKMALEWEGIFGGKSRHLNVIGYTKDCEKYNEALALGWYVIRITAKMQPNIIKEWLQTGRKRKINELSE